MVLPPFPPGTSLGPYDVTTQIGVGGIVYRATERNLKRQIAVKGLPGGGAE